MQRGSKQIVEDRFRADRVAVRWHSEPFDGEEVYTVCELKPGCACWNIYLVSTGDWVGYAVRYGPAALPGR